MASVMFMALKDYVLKLIESMPSEHKSRFVCHFRVVNKPIFNIWCGQNEICSVEQESNTEVMITWKLEYREGESENLTYGHAAESILDCLEVMCLCYFDIVDFYDFFVMDDSKKETLSVRFLDSTDRPDYPIHDLLKRVDQVVKKLQKMSGPLDEKVRDTVSRAENLQKASEKTKEISKSSSDFATSLRELLRKLSGDGATPPGP